MRHRQRHLHKTVLEYLRTELTALGWDDGLFGTPGITLVDYEPIAAGETPAENTVAVSIGNQLEDQVFELGGGLLRCEYVLFVDIYGGNAEAVSVALADDIKDALWEEIIPLRDYTSDAAGVETTDQIEFERILVEVIPSAATTLDKRTWRSVKAMAVLYHG
jgi:hypothetical protein